jgi:hypothetical protein
MSTNISVVHNTTTPGDFSLVTCFASRRYLNDGYQAVTKTDGGWDFLKNNHPPENMGFMFWNNNKVNEIVSNMETKDEHSGSSMAYVLRNMEFIATHGWDSWCEKSLPPKIKEGDFSFVENNMDRTFYEDAYSAITNTDGGWDFLKTNSPPHGKGFMTWSHPTLDKITNNMNQIGNHSGASFALTMRAMESIAKNDWSTWVTNYKEAQKKYA